MPITKISGSKDGKQKYRVRVNYIDNLGRYKQIERTAYGREEAKQLEMSMNVDLKKRTPTAVMTMNKLFEEYSLSARSELRETSYSKNMRILQTYVLAILGDLPMGKLTAPVLQNWKNQIDEYKTSKGKYLSLRTKQNIYSCFRTMLNYAIRLDYISTNNLKKIGNFKGFDTIKKEMQFYTAEEYKRFAFEALSRAEQSNGIKDWDFYVFFSIAFYTGLRKGEIHALKWSDLDGVHLNVKRSISQKLKGGDRETLPKNKSSIRTLQMPLPLIDILKKHKKRYGKVDGFSEDFRICGGTAPLRDTSLQNYNKAISAAAELKTIRIHDFRHSHVSLLANEGINIQEIARRLGHSNIEMTWNTYSHLYPREEERAVNVLNRVV